jgi:hypothetical protein
MIVRNIVKIRTKRYFERQPLWVIIGKVLEFSENWVRIDGRGIGFFHRKVNPIAIDKEDGILLLPQKERDGLLTIKVQGSRI